MAENKKLKIVEVEVKKLKEAGYNPRKMSQGDIRKLRTTIREFGMVLPIIVNKDLTVIGGHQRLKVAKQMEMTGVPCVILDLTEAKAKALNIALNKIHGDWEWKMLKDVLQGLDTGEFDIGVTGFDSKEIEDLMTRFGDEYKKPEVEFSEELLLKHNYIVLYFDNPLDWEVAKERFGLKKVKDLVKRKGQPTGVGRVVNGADWLERIA